jgi:hypothetical protein
MRYLKFFILLFFILAVIKAEAQVYTWQPMSEGTNGKVYAMTSFNGQLIIAGGFSQAGGTAANNIAKWNGTSYEPLGLGTNDTVYALTVFNNQLIAAGRFMMAGGQNASRIARWNGTSWMAFPGFFDDEIKALIVYNSNLIAGGNFSLPTSNIASWNGSSWSQIGTGFNDDVYALTIYNSILVAGGKFNNNNLNRVAWWNGTTWNPYAGGLDERVFALTVHNNELYAGGRFTGYLMKWSSGTWQQLGSGVDDRVFALASYKGSLIAAGQFKFAGGIYSDRIASFNGTDWSRIGTGMNNKVNALFVIDSSLYAGGEFTTAGGYFAYRVAVWANRTTSFIDGSVKYSDNQTPVLTGIVKAWRIDDNSREMILVDSAVISNGSYRLNKIPKDTVYIISFPDDELDFVPTYYPSTIDWQQAVRIIPVTNLYNVNVSVHRITPGNGQNSFSVGGYVYLNYLPPLILSGELPFKSDAIVYIKQGNLYRAFDVSNSSEHYLAANLPGGSYEFYVNRAGYISASKNVFVSTSTDTINFTLDTTSMLIGLEKKNETKISDKYLLYQNYPNPFNPSTKIQFNIPYGSRVSNVQLNIYNSLGQHVESLVNAGLSPGLYIAEWNSQGYSSGIYYYSLIVDGNIRSTRKMILVK